MGCSLLSWSDWYAALTVLFFLIILSQDHDLSERAAAVLREQRPEVQEMVLQGGTLTTPLGEVGHGNVGDDNPCP